MLREALGRRGLFKRLGVGALLAASGQENIAKVARISVGPGAVGTTLGAAGIPIKPMRVFKAASEFTSWWKEFGEDEARRRSQYVNSIDPDIAAFRLPLPTKIRMQRERQFERIREDRRQNFLMQIFRQGEFREWGDNGPEAPTADYAGSSRGGSLG